MYLTSELRDIYTYVSIQLHETTVPSTSLSLQFSLCVTNEPKYTVRGDLLLGRVMGAVRKT